MGRSGGRQERPPRQSGCGKQMGTLPPVDLWKDPAVARDKIHLPLWWMRARVASSTTRQPPRRRGGLLNGTAPRGWLYPEARRRVVTTAWGRVVIAARRQGGIGGVEVIFSLGTVAASGFTRRYSSFRTVVIVNYSCSATLVHRDCLYPYGREGGLTWSTVLAEHVTHLWTM